MVCLAKTLFKNGGEIKLIPSGNQLSKILTNHSFAKLLKLPQADDCKVSEFDVPSEPEMVAVVRKRASDFAKMLPFSKEDIEDIKLAVGEASTNAIRHGANPKWCMVGVKMEKCKNAMKIQISDKGCGFNPDVACKIAADDFSEGGRGILFMKALMDEVRFHSKKKGTTVELVKRFH